MFRYKVIQGAAHIHSGIVVISADQLSRRAHNLEVIESLEDSTACRVVQPIMFKQGEIFSHDQGIDKQQRGAVAYIGDDDPDEEQEDEPEDEPFDDETGEPYAAMDREELRTELNSRGVKFDGRSGAEDMRELLRAIDAESV